MHTNKKQDPTVLAFSSRVFPYLQPYLHRIFKSNIEAVLSLVKSQSMGNLLFCFAFAFWLLEIIPCPYLAPRTVRSVLLSFPVPVRATSSLYLSYLHRIFTVLSSQKQQCRLCSRSVACWLATHVRLRPQRTELYGALEGSAQVVLANPTSEDPTESVEPLWRLRKGNCVSETVVVGSNGLLSAYQPGAEVVEGRAPGWPYLQIRGRNRSGRSQAAAAAAHSETSPESSNASEDSEKREDGRRETIEEDNSESGDSACSSISRAQAAQSYLRGQSQAADEAKCIQPIPNPL